MSSNRNLRYAVFGAVLIAGFFLIAGIASAAPSIPSIPTLRVYGGHGGSAGDLDAHDPRSNLRPEDPPYTGADGLNSIFDPEGPQAPRMDSVTWNPAWMYEYETCDENQYQGLYHQFYSDDANISEKAWFRMWYEPMHQGITVTIGGVLTTTYPAIMQEFTYALMETPGYAALSDSFPPNPSRGRRAERSSRFLSAAGPPILRALWDMG